MRQVTIRELRNEGGRVLARVTQGESLIVTRGGLPVAELRPLPTPGPTAEALLARWRGLPRVDAERLRADLDSVVNASL